MRPPLDLAPLWRCAHGKKPLLYPRDFTTEDRETLLREGLLRETAPATAVPCPSCLHDGHFIDLEMETRPDGSVRHFGLCPECGVVELARDDYALLAPDYGAVALCLSLALEMSKPMEEKVAGHLWKLGQAQFNRKTRFAWMLRAPEGIPSGFLPSSGVAFTVGHIPPGLLPDALLAIPVEEAVYWNEGLRVDESICETSAGDAEAGAPAPERRTKAAKGASMVDLRGKLAKALLEHIRTQRDIGRRSLDEGERWKLPDPPKQSDLARWCGVSEAGVSRAMRYPILKYYMRIAEDEEAVLTFSGAGC